MISSLTRSLQDSLHGLNRRFLKRRHLRFQSRIRMPVQDLQKDGFSVQLQKVFGVLFIQMGHFTGIGAR